MEMINSCYTVVPLLFAQQHDGALAGDIISMKNFRQAEIFLMIGNTLGQVGAITMKKGVSVSSCATALAFTRYFETGFVLEYDGASTDVSEDAGAAFTGSGGGAGVVYKDLGNKLIAYGYNGTTFVDNETITFTTSGRTALANGIQKNEDILVPRTAAANTFNVQNEINRLYCIPIKSDDLGDGYDCITINVADLNMTDLAAWVVLHCPRYAGEIAETAIYD